MIVMIQVPMVICTMKLIIRNILKYDQIAKAGGDSNVRDVVVHGSCDEEDDM